MFWRRVNDVDIRRFAGTLHYSILWNLIVDDRVVARVMTHDGSLYTHHRSASSTRYIVMPCDSEDIEEAKQIAQALYLLEN